MFAMLAVLVYLLAMGIPIYLLYRFQSQAWYWHTLSVLAAAGLGFIPIPLEFQKPQFDLLFGFVFIFADDLGRRRPDSVPSARTRPSSPREARITPPPGAAGRSRLETQRVVLALHELRREGDESHARLQLDHGVVRPRDLERSQESCQTAHRRQVFEGAEFQVCGPGLPQSCRPTSVRKRGSIAWCSPAKFPRCLRTPLPPSFCMYFVPWKVNRRPSGGANSMW